MPPVDLTPIGEAAMRAWFEEVDRSLRSRPLFADLLPRPIRVVQDHDPGDEHPEPHRWAIERWGWFGVVVVRVRR